MRWLCDEMLARLARLLRAAGHDAALAQPGQPDAGLLAQAIDEGRRLLTRDRGLAAAAGARAILLAEDSVEGQARGLSRAAAVDWLAAPFSRCVMDNTPLRPARPEEIAELPASSQILPGPFNACPRCGRLYWPGSHVKRMTARLERLQQTAGNERAVARVGRDERRSR